MCWPILNEEHEGWLLRLRRFHLMHKPRESRHGQVTKRIQNVPASSSTKPKGVSLKPTEEANLETKCWCSPLTAKTEKKSKYIEQIGRIQGLNKKTARVRVVSVFLNCVSFQIPTGITSKYRTYWTYLSTCWQLNFWDWYLACFSTGFPCLSCDVFRASLRQLVSRALTSMWKAKIWSFHFMEAALKPTPNTKNQEKNAANA